MLTEARSGTTISLHYDRNLGTDEDKSRVRSLWNGNDHHGLMTLAGDAAHPMLPRKV